MFSEDRTVKTFAMFAIATSAALVGCVPLAPKELVHARLTYQRTTSAPAARLVPAEVQKAKEALARAEESFAKEGAAYRTRDLAYVATRKAEMANALAMIDASKGRRADSDKTFQNTQTQIVAKTKRELADTRKDLASSELGGAQSRSDLAKSELSGDQARKELAASEKTGQETAGELTAERSARIAAEKLATDALAALSKLGEVKQEERGLVITLSGSVLFASAKATLLPMAQTRLNQVADALLTTRERTLVVEGHTDSRGTESYNLELSQRRANAVREYLMVRGYGGALIVAHGMGKGRPVASNKTAEGRANNRRVEIIVQKGTPVAMK